MLPLLLLLLSGRPAALAGPPASSPLLHQQTQPLPPLPLVLPPVLNPHRGSIDAPPLTAGVVQWATTRRAIHSGSRPSRWLLRLLLPRLLLGTLPGCCCCRRQVAAGPRYRIPGRCCRQLHPPTAAAAPAPALGPACQLRRWAAALCSRLAWRG